MADVEIAEAASSQERQALRQALSGFLRVVREADSDAGLILSRLRDEVTQTRRDNHELVAKNAELASRLDWHREKLKAGVDQTMEGALAELSEGFKQALGDADAHSAEMKREWTSIYKRLAERCQELEDRRAEDLHTISRLGRELDVRNLETRALLGDVGAAVRLRHSSRSRLARHESREEEKSQGASSAGR